MSWFFGVFAFGLVVFLTEKTIATLHFGTREWPRWLWAMLAVGLCPAILLPVFWGEAGQLRGLAFAVAAIYFSIKFLEDGAFWDAPFPVAVVAGQVFLGIEIPVFEWAVLAAVGLFFLKKKGALSSGQLFGKTPFWAIGLLFLGCSFGFGIPSGNWDWHRIGPVFLPFWPIFGLFMPICLFFLKKTDVAPFPKKWLAAASAASILAAILWPSTRVAGLQLAWIGLVVLAFPVFERGLLYGLVFVKKWKIWAIVVGFALVQVGVVFYFL